MKRCSHEGCGRKLNADNKSGLCLAHYAEARFAAARAVPICTGCGRNAVSDDSRTGLCLTCYKAAHVHVRRCDCGKPITKANRTGNCLDCYYAAQGFLARRCGHEGCGQPIQRSNKSGFCRVHKSDVRTAKPNDAAVLVARQVGKALGVEARDIFGRDQASEIVEARAIVAMKLRERGLSWNRVGMRLGRDHSSVINLVKRLPIYAQRNPLVAAYLNEAA